MTDWMLELVGVPYKKDGENPDEGFDCLTLGKWCAAHEGVILPSTKQWFSWRHYADILDRDTPLRRYDWLMFWPGTCAATTHVGINVDGVNFLHAWKLAEQVVLSRIARYPYKVVGRLRF